MMQNQYSRERGFTHSASRPDMQLSRNNMARGAGAHIQEHFSLAQKRMRLMHTRPISTLQAERKEKREKRLAKTALHC